MEYITEVAINLPLDEVLRLFDNTENAYRWQPGLKEVRRLGGEERSEGARYRLRYEGRKSDLIAEESVIVRRLPEEYTTMITSPGVVNTVQNLFAASVDGTTRWKVVNHFRFRGLMKWMAPFMKQAFRSNTLLSMERFKMFAENHNQHQPDSKNP